MRKRRKGGKSKRSDATLPSAGWLTRNQRQSGAVGPRRAGVSAGIDFALTLAARIAGDEVGELARVLDAMVTRLRDHARSLADAEHRAHQGDGVKHPGVVQQ